MKASEVAAYAARALRVHPLRTALSLTGVAIGVASVILLTSLGQGARLYVTREFASLGTNLVIILPGKTETAGITPNIVGTAHDLTLEDAEAVARRVPQVRRVAPLCVGAAPARFGERSRLVTVAGTTADFLPVRRVRLQVGRFLSSGDARRAQALCVIGAKIQKELFPSRNPLGEMLRLGDERFRVVGVMESRGVSMGNDFDDMVYVPVASAMKMFNRSSLFELLAEVGTHEDIPAASRGVIRVLRERHENTQDVTLLTQDSVISTFGRILSTLTLALGGIAAVSLTVAGIGIMNVMLVSVSERRPEVGLLKAVGVTPSQVISVFLAESAILSMAGGLVGLAAGFGLVRAARALYPALPAQPPGWAVVSAIVLSIGVGTAFGVLPARRAARLDPIEALAKR